MWPDRLDYRRDLIKQNIFREIKDPKHPLHYLLPPVKVSHSQMVLQPTYPYQLPLSEAIRYGRDFVVYCVFPRNFSVQCVIIFAFLSLLLFN